jgi:hypothetical protein
MRRARAIPLVHDPAFRQQIFDVAEAQREPNIEPDRVLDDFGRKAIAAIADFDHRGWYGYRSVTASPRRRDKALRRAGKGVRRVIGNGAATAIDDGLASLIARAIATRNMSLAGRDDSIDRPP